MPSYTQSILSPDPLYLQPKSYDARSDRKPYQDMLYPGVVGLSDFLTTWTSGMGIQVTGGVAWILGQNIADQGMYRQYVAGTTSMTVTASNPTNPRIDQVILRVLDNAADAGGSNEARIEIVPGTATAGATLSNRNGAANLTTLLENSKSVLLIADILVPAGAVTLDAAKVADRRPYASSGVAVGSRSVTVAQFVAMTQPYDNQIINILVDSATGTRWSFRYNAGSGSSFKWEYTGGKPLYVEILTSQSTASTTYVDLATAGPSIVLPRSGDYDWHLSVSMANATANFNMLAAIKRGASAAADADATWGICSANNAIASFARQFNMTGLTGGDTFKVQYRTGGGTASFLNRGLLCTPVRIA